MATMAKEMMEKEFIRFQIRKLYRLLSVSRSALDQGACRACIRKLQAELKKLEGTRK